MLFPHLDLEQSAPLSSARRLGLVPGITRIGILFDRARVTFRRLGFLAHSSLPFIRRRLIRTITGRCRLLVITAVVGIAVASVVHVAVAVALGGRGLRHREHLVERELLAGGLGLERLRTQPRL